MHRSWLLAPSLALAACASAAPPAPKPAPRSPSVEELASACGEVERYAALARQGTAETPEAIALSYLDRCGTRDAIALLAKLVEFPTVSAREPAKDGPAFRGMAEFLEGWAKANGLEFERYGENDAWEVAFGKGAPSVRFVMHADVVPIDDGLDPAKSKTAEGDLPTGWSHPPFKATLLEDKVFARGAEDDKGPIAAVLTMLRVLAAAGYQPKGRLIAAMGTGEENDWDGMVRYAKTSTKATHTISVDSNYPVVVAESGFVAWQLATPLEATKKSSRKRIGQCTPAVHAIGGQFLTQVPGEASLTVAPPRKSAAQKALLARAKKIAGEVIAARGAPFRAEVAADGANNVRITVHGDAVHSSEAHRGHNALWPLAEIAGKIELCEGGIQAMLAAIARYFDSDHFGQKLHLAYEDELMGGLLVSPTVLRVEKAEVTLGVNMRRPRGQTSAEFGARLDQALAEIQKNVSPTIRESAHRYVGEPAVANTEGPLVSTLLEVYREKSGDKEAKPISIKGGTYARLFPGAVDFGPQLPGRTYRGHAPDEYIEVDALKLMSRTLGEVAVKLDGKAAAATAKEAR
jgi:predicted dipeptidase